MGWVRVLAHRMAWQLPQAQGGDESCDDSDDHEAAGPTTTPVKSTRGAASTKAESTPLGARTSGGVSRAGSVASIGDGLSLAADDEVAGY